MIMMPREEIEQLAEELERRASRQPPDFGEYPYPEGLVDAWRDSARRLRQILERFPEGEAEATLSPCPLCGHPVGMDWGACFEVGGRCWQTLSVRCTNPKGYGCYVHLSIEVDGDHRGLVGAANRVAARAWNAFVAHAQEKGRA